MAYPRRLLGDDEDVVLDLHPHAKALVVPVLAVPLVVGLAVFLAVAMPDGSLQAAGRWTVLALAVLALALVSLVPYLRWRTTSYVLTTERLITRSGVLSRTGRDMPLRRINDVSFSHGPLERLLGCGTVVVESAGERGQLVLADVPRVEHVQCEIYRLVDDRDDDRDPRDHRGEHDGGAAWDDDGARR